MAIKKQSESTKKRIYGSEDLEEEFRASAEFYSELSNELGLAFRDAQEEAYETYCAWEAKVKAEHQITGAEENDA